MIKITKPGLLTSIQDLGRHGFQKYGVIASGVMDQLAHRIANILVGNEENEATLEITLLGPVIEFEEDQLIAICGGDLSPMINGEPVRLWRSILVKKGSTLRFGRYNNGCRAYLAIAGGFMIPEVMGSKSTYLRAEIGGFKGRALKEGDFLITGLCNTISLRIIDKLSKAISDKAFCEIEWSVSSDLIPYLNGSTSIRVIKGRQYHLFSRESQEGIFSEPFEVTSQSDRMGYRLKGPFLELENASEMISEAVSFGSIQIPSEGNPIVLLADRQTTGGYPKIGQIASIDLPKMAQFKPGDKLHFIEISHEDAQLLYLDREKKIGQLKQGMLLKLR